MELTDDVVDGLLKLWTAKAGPVLAELAKVAQVDKLELEGAFSRRVAALLVTEKSYQDYAK